MQNIRYVLFLGATGLLLGALGYFATFTKLPDGIHFIRQADSLSFVLNYIFFEDNFFTPTNFNLISEQGKAASEFPIIYFLVAKIQALWNQPAVIIRIIHALIFFGGLQIFFVQLFKNKIPLFLAVVATLTLCTSTVVLYYSNNYLPDIAALGLTIAGVALSLRKEKKYILIAIELFTLAALLKVTYAIYPIAFLTVLFLFKKHYSFSTQYKLIYAFIFFLPVMAWWIYVHYYNMGVENSYYANRAIPIWKTPQAQISATTDLILNYWKNSYYPPATQLLLICMIGAFIIFFKKIETYKKMYFGLVLAGLGCFVILFYQKFHDHDYYFMIVIPAVALLFLTVIPELISYCKTKFLKIGLYLFFLAPVIMSYRYVWIKIPNRWETENNLQSHHVSLENMLSKLNQEDPEHLQKILVVGDSTMNGTLYQLQRKGFSFPIIPTCDGEVIVEEIIETVDWIVYLKKPGSMQPALPFPNTTEDTFPILVKN
jgi:hypothetical protein